MAVIKQLWFVRNPYKLVGQLGIAVSAFSLFYSLLCLWALLFGADTQGGAVIDFLSRFGGLLPLPLISTAFSVAAYCIYIRLAKRGQSAILIIKLVTGFSLSIPAVLFFWQLHLLNTAKQIQGFGMLPAYLCLGVGIVYTIFVIIKTNMKSKGKSQQGAK